LVVDETSMVDVALMRAVFRALPERSALLLVGDVDQLPSVGPGQVLGEIIASASVPIVRLTEVFRQAAESRIIVNAHRINHGPMPDLAPVESGDFYFVDAVDAEEVMRVISGSGTLAARRRANHPRRSSHRDGDAANPKPPCLQNPAAAFGSCPLYSAESGTELAEDSSLEGSGFEL
jgi:ATP-dependent exoDNAse (exonuclease V) alpha subunit